MQRLNGKITIYSDNRKRPRTLTPLNAFLARLLANANPLVRGINIMVRPKPEPWQDTNVSANKSLTLNDDHLSDTEKLDRWKLYKQTPAYLRDLVWLSSQGKGV